jgi:hypothetical protein
MFVPTKDEASEKYGVKHTATATVIADNNAEQVVQFDDRAMHLGRMHLTGHLRVREAKVGDRVKMSYITSPSSGLWYAGPVLEGLDTPRYHDWHLARLDEEDKPLAKFSLIRDWSVGPVAYLNVDRERADEIAAIIGAVPKLLDAAFRLVALDKPDKNGVRQSPSAADIEVARSAIRSALNL